MFLKKLASKLIPRGGSGEPERPVRVAAFGKHPAWDDHTDDIGLESERLVTTKRLLYVDGIGGNIDSGAWEKLRDDQQLAEFDHLFLWRTGQEVVIGRFWSSKDGKGRSRYPMVVCAHCSHLPLSWVMANVAVGLETLKSACQCASTSEAVRNSVESLQQELLAQSPTPEEDRRTRIETGVLSQLWAREELGPDGVGLTRVLYQIERELGGYRPRTASGVRTAKDDGRAQHMRVPACADEPVEAVQLWLRMLDTQLDAAVGVFIIAPMRAGWVDLIVGEPGVAQFFAIRASRATIPLTSEIPYNIEPQFLRNVRQLIAL